MGEAAIDAPAHRAAERPDTPLAERSRTMTLFAELRRRNVFRVAAAYAVVAWLIVQVGDVAADNLAFPDWFMPMLFVLLGLGFPVALFLAWAFEMTPQGVQKTADADRDTTMTGSEGGANARGLNLLIVLGLVAVIAVLAIERLWFAQAPDTTTSAPAAAAEAAEAASIAVLPFVNMSSDAEQAYFSDGITEEIINTLVRRTDLSVAARTSVFAFKGENRNVSEIGRSLDVSHVIEGSVRSAGDQVRITAQLIKVEDGFHLWSDTYDRELTNIFAVQEEIAASVADALSKTLLNERPGSTRATTDPITYDLYLQGRALLRLRGEERLARAASLLSEAIERDPAFAPAWATAAQVADVSERQDDAIEHAERALSLDPNNVDALNALGASYRDSFRWTEAETTLERALELDPESSELLEDYAEFLGTTGRISEMLEVARRGWLIDPFLPPLAAVYAEALMSTGDAGEALRVLDDLNRIADSPIWIQGYRFAALREVGDRTGMIELVRGLPGGSSPMREAVLATLRDPADEAAVEYLANATSALPVNDFSPDAMVAQYTLLDVGRAQPVLDFVLRQGQDWILPDLEWIHAPLFDSLRALPGFPELLETVRLPEYWDANGWPDYCNRLPSGEIRCR